MFGDSKATERELEKTEILLRIKNRITEGDIKSAINFGMKYLKSNDFISLASRYKRIKKAYLKGLVTFEQHQVELNKITEAILESLQSYPDKTRRRKRRIEIIFWVFFSGLFTDWGKVWFLIKVIITLVSVPILYIVVSNVLKSEDSFNATIIDTENAPLEECRIRFITEKLDTFEAMSNQNGAFNIPMQIGTIDEVEKIFVDKKGHETQTVKNFILSESDLLYGQFVIVVDFNEEKK